MTAQVLFFDVFPEKDPHLDAVEMKNAFYFIFKALFTLKMFVLTF